MGYYQLNSQLITSPLLQIEVVKKQVIIIIIIIIVIIIIIILIRILILILLFKGRLFVGLDDVEDLRNILYKNNFLPIDQIVCLDTYII